MTREQLKKQALEESDALNGAADSLYELCIEPATGKRLADLIIRMDTYIDKLELELAYWKRDPAQARLETRVEK